MQRYKSFLMGRDYEVLNILIPLHSRADSPYIVDVTHNKGVMWKKMSLSACGEDGH